MLVAATELSSSPLEPEDLRWQSSAPTLVFGLRSAKSFFGNFGTTRPNYPAPWQRPKPRSTLDARTALCCNIERHWPGAPVRASVRPGRSRCDPLTNHIENLKPENLFDMSKSDQAKRWNRNDEAASM